MSNDKVVGIGTGKPVQQGEAIQNVEVYFKHNGQVENARVMESFPDVIGYQIGGGAFGVTEKNGKTTIYNWDEISSVVHEIKE